MLFVIVKENVQSLVHTVQKCFSLNNANIKPPAFGCFWGRVFPADIAWSNFNLPVWINIRILYSATEQLMFWMMMTFSLYLFFIKLYSEHCLGEWSRVASQAGGQRKGHIPVNHLHFLAACFYGPLLHFNIFQSCQVVSVLLGLDRREG